ncbi:MAG: methionyl-tRNA formyltransferase [Lachnospiraceae bacterium]|nr:methionyl-tRNA formyltransferase [Lachnospiraceae bacterium]
MKIVFMGTPDFASGILEAIVDAGYEVAGVVTQPDKPKGRKKALSPCPVKEVAEKAGLNVFQPVRARDPEAVQKIAEMGADLIVVAAFGQILPKEILLLPPLGCINVHASLLPAYRGASPIQHAILDGCPVTGVTIMQMDEGLDTGDIISVREVPIEDTDTGGTLSDKLSVAGAGLLIETLPSILDGTAARTPQPAESPTPYCRMIKKDAGVIDWGEDADVIERRVRAFAPWPSAYTCLDGKTFKIWSAEAVAGEAGLRPGEFALKDGMMHIQAGRGQIVPKEVQIEGKRRMSVGDFIRGYRFVSHSLT